jgi:hypothetical protein
MCVCMLNDIECTCVCEIFSYICRVERNFKLLLLRLLLILDVRTHLLKAAKQLVKCLFALSEYHNLNTEGS